MDERSVVTSITFRVGINEKAPFITITLPIFGFNRGTQGAGARFAAGGSLRAGTTSMFTGSGPGYGGAPSGQQGTARTQSDPWGKVRKFALPSVTNESYIGTKFLCFNSVVCMVTQVHVWENDES